jgi:hypothetical protein
VLARPCPVEQPSVLLAALLNLRSFDPANPGPPPDPERWLPKWQRSDAKKQRKKQRGKVGGCGC